MRYVLRDGVLVPKHLAGPKHKSDPATYIISDTMEPVKHMGTGRVLDSKSEFRRDTRAMGCEEVGTDPAIKRPPPRYRPDINDIATDVRRSLAEVRSR